MALVGSIEAGGTKFVLALGDENNQILDRVSIPTTTPAETLARTLDFFKQHPVSAIGLGSFGPLDINPKSPHYGFITHTPKAGWAQTDLLGSLTRVLNIPISFTTDVNASAYGEKSATGVENLVYFTIGTGIGGGALQNGAFIGGIAHAEMGHQFVKRHPDDTAFPGICPFHGDCLEGVASGPAIEARAGRRGETIPEDDETWEILAYYLAQAALNATLTLAPEKIIFGGGVMAQQHMLARVRKQFSQLLADYVTLPSALTDYLVLPVSADNGSATLGNFVLAREKSYQR